MANAPDVRQVRKSRFWSYGIVAAVLFFCTFGFVGGWQGGDTWIRLALLVASGVMALLSAINGARGYFGN